MIPKQAQTSAAASWRDSRNVCAFSDADRHLGHIVRAGEGWIAFDATHATNHGASLQSLGFFATRAAAKEAVQMATVPLSRSATAGMTEM